MAAGLSAWYLLMPPMGTDLSAQVARGNFVRAYGLSPIDMSWYGGVNQFAYSLTTPVLIALVGARWLGVASVLVTTGALTTLMVRTSATRATLGGALIAAGAIDNLISGRITFAAGIAVASCAMFLASRPPPPRRILRLAVIGLLAALSGVTSPVGAVFLGLGALAWFLSELRWADIRVRVLPVGEAGLAALALGGGAVLGLIPMAMFSDGGRQPYALHAMRDYVALSLVVALVLPATRRALRFGAVLSAVLLAVTYYAASPLGGNVLRLPMLFAIPVVAAYVPWRTWVLIAALLIIVWWRPPINVNDVRHAGDSETKASFYQPLVSELSGLGPLGRIEVVPLRAHWESTYLAERVPLARGWLRQADIARNPGFYRASPMSAAEYDTWLHTNAVSYVAAASGQPLDSAATTEAAIVSSAPSYLRAIWHRGAWTLYRVIDAAPFVTGAAAGLRRRRHRHF